METKERFIMFLKTKKIGQTAFEEFAGLSRGSISQKNGFSSKSIEKIATACPELNLNWLFTGNGNMFNTENNAPDIKTGDMQNIYETVVRDKDEQIEKMKAEINQLIGENSIMREQLGIASRKVSNKSA